MPGAKFFLALLAASCATPSNAFSGPGPLPNWSTATAVPDRVVNILRVDGNRLLWNGKETSESHVREFLGIVANELDPQPLMILSYSAQTPQERIQRARLLVDEVIKCTPAACLEVTPSRA